MPKEIIFKCVGCRYNNRIDKWNSYFSSNNIASKEQTPPNSYLFLKREPDNPYDKNAIAVMTGGEIFGTLGYVAREDIPKVSEFIGKNKKYENVEFVENKSLAIKILKIY